MEKSKNKLGIYENILLVFDFAMINSKTFEKRTEKNNRNLFHKTELYSDITIRNLRETFINFLKFILNNNEEITAISDIELKDFENYLKFKRNTVSEISYNQIGVRLEKIINIMQVTYGKIFNFKYKVDYISKLDFTYNSDNVEYIKSEDYAKILEVCSPEYRLYLKIIKNLKVKISDLPKIKMSDIYIRNNNLFLFLDGYIKKIELTDEVIKLHEDMIELFGEVAPICNIKPASIRKSFQRALNKSNLEQYKGCLVALLKSM